MNCPVCDERLRPIQRSGIEIDICPGCKGIWLDRGELEKLIALEGNESALPAAETRWERPRENPPRPDDFEHDRHGHDAHRRNHDDDHDDRRDGHGYRPQGPRRRGSWLGDLLGGLGGDD